MDILSKIENLANNYYQGRDISHGIYHAKNVVKNANLIIKSLENKDSISDDSKNLILASALLHDTYDHKYYTSLEITNIKKNLKQDLVKIGFSEKKAYDILLIIDNISFSREFNNRKNGIYMDLGELQSLRDIVSDADKIDSLGLEGITRMIEFEKNVVGHKDDDLIKQHLNHIQKHCREKLYLLVSENYIKTNYGKEVASKLINEMKEIVEDDNKLSLFILEKLKT